MLRKEIPPTTGPMTTATPELRTNQEIVPQPYRTTPKAADSYIDQPDMRLAPLALLATTLLAPSLIRSQTYTISTYAGGALPINIPGPTASLYGPQSAIAIDPNGNIFFADGNTILRLDAATNQLTLAAGNGTAGYSGDNGPATSAQLRNPYGLAIDSAGNLYIGSSSDNVIRKVSAGIITTIAGNGTAGAAGDNGPATAAQLNAPYGIAVDPAGNLYIADNGNHRIREVSGGIITSIAGDGTPGFSGDTGTALSAQLKNPFAVAIDPAGNLYISDRGNNRIRKITNGVVDTVAGNGTPGYGGDNGPATSAQLDAPCGIALDPTGNLLIADYYNNRVRKVLNGVISTVVGSPQLNSPYVLALDSAANLYIADFGNNRILKVAAGIITTVAGNGTQGFSGDGGSPLGAQLHAPQSIALDSAGDLFTADSQNNRIRSITAGIINTVGTTVTPPINQPAAVALDSTGALYIADQGNNRILKLSGGLITTIAPTAQFNQPSGLAFDSFGNLYIADSANHRIAKVANGVVTTVAGNGTPGLSGDGAAATAAQLNTPTAVALDSAGSLYIADTANNRIRKVTGGNITTIGLGFNGPTALAVASANTLYIADTLNNQIQKLAAGVTTTLVVTNASGAGVLNNPKGVGLDSAGNIYVADTGNNRIVLLTQVPLSITGPASLPSGSVAASYTSTTFAATGGIGPYTWSSTGLPKGLTFTTAGVLSGTPTTAGVNTPQFTVKDAAQHSASVTLSLPIDVPIPALSALSPATATVYGAAYTLTVNGTGFITGATVQWNGTALTTKLVSATQLTASVTATLLASPGTATITVSSGGNASNSIDLPINPPNPTLTAISPKTASATGPAFTLTATGTGYVSSSIVEWNGAALSTTFVSPTQLTASVPAGLIASAGTASIVTYSGGPTSAAQSFTITPPPIITALSPASVTAYGPAFTLTVNGAGFAAGAVIQWNSANLTTKVVSPTQLTASVPANTIAGAGNVNIVVISGGITSDPFQLPVNPPPPVISTLVPASAIATGAAFTLTVNGSGFGQSSTVQWNGAQLTTTFVSASQVTAYVATSQIAAAGTVSVTVGSSAAATFTVTAPPAITTLTPAAIAVGGPAFTLKVVGTGFVSGAQVQWNGAPVPTTFVSATQLTAAVQANLITSAGSVTILVYYSGASSSGAQLPISAPPAITTGGVVPLYSSTPVIQAGSWISIYGTSLASGTSTWAGDYPTTLGGTSVKINGKAAYLWFVSPTQINLQAPNDTSAGAVSVVVTSPGGNTTSTVTLAPYGPSFSLLPASNYAATVIYNYSGAARPVKPGEILELYGVGFGPTKPAVPAGKAYSGAAPTTNPVTVTIGGVPAKVLFAGAVASGVYQLNVVVPAAPSGDQPLIATVGGVQTPTGVLIPIQ